MKHPGKLPRAIAWLLVAALAFAAAGARRAFADFPALSHEMVPAAFTDLGAGAPAVHGLASVSWFSRSLEPGVGDPRVSKGELGGRGGASLIYGRWAIGGDATVDGRFNVDAREYPSRFWLESVWPWIAVRGVAGLDEDQYGGTDVMLEAAPVTISGDRAGRRLDVQAFVRGRKFERFDEPILNPALAVAARRIRAGAGALDLALSAQIDFARRNHPDSFGMVQAVWAPAPREEGERLSAGGGRGDALWRTLYAHGAYAFPLDTRHHARLALGVGVRVFADFSD